MEATPNDKQEEGGLGNPAPLIISVLILGGVIWGAFALAGSTSTDATATNTTPSVITTVYTISTVNVRSCPSTDCKSIGTYEPNYGIDLTGSQYAGVTDMSQLPDWLLLNFSDGTSGYLSKTVLSATQISATDASAQTSGNVATNQAQQTSEPAHATGLPAIVKEWRPSTAYLECYWDYAGGTKWYYKQSGSGLLVSFNSVPTVITNKHVVYSSQYGMPQECDVAFPDDKYVFYSIDTADIPAHPNIIAGGPEIPDQPANGQIQFTADGSDVAYLSGFKENNIGYNYTPPLSLQGRVKGGSVACTAKPNIGDPLVVIGYPVYGSDIASVLSTIEVTATEGIISGDSEGYYTTSAKIDHGNSGGLAIDTTNDCYLGIPSAALTGSIESLGRILPVSYVLK